MASSSSKRKNARGLEETAASIRDAIMFVEMAKYDDVNYKFLLDKATEALRKGYHSLQTSTKQGKITRDQFRREITTCDPKHKDGYNWAKYGKKKNKEFNDNPKDYYYCSNKRKNGCPAKRHVQRVNSHEYRAIYYGIHTCGGIQNQQQQQQHSPPLVPSEHGSASTVQSPNISSSIPATPPPEPAGQNNEDDDFYNTLLSISEEIDLDSVLRNT